MEKMIEQHEAQAGYDVTAGSYAPPPTVVTNKDVDAWIQRQQQQHRR